MFSLPTLPSSYLVLTNIVEIAIIYFLLKGALHPPYKVPTTNRKMAIFFMFMFVLFSFWGADWFHYYEGYEDLVKGYSGHMEGIYVWIAQHFSFDYISFRFAIWGIGLILVINLYNRLPINTDLALLFFGTIWILWFSYARVSMAVVLALWGVSLLIIPFRNINKCLSFVIGLLAIVCSVYFHKTALFIVFVVIIAYITLRFNFKWIAVIVLIASVVFFYVVNTLLSDFFMMEGDFRESGMSQTIAYGQYYLNQTSTGQGGIGLRVSFFLEQASFFLVGYQCALFSLKQEKMNSSLAILLFMRVTLIIIFIALILQFVDGYNTATLFRRFLRYAQISSAVVFAYFWESNKYPRLNKITLIIGLSSTIYSIGYQLYLAL